MAERGLQVWLQPTLGDVPEKEILEHLAESGRHGERLRRQGAQVTLAVGCEFWLFVPGIAPGADVFERIDNLEKGNFDLAKVQKRLARFTAKAAAVGRSVFRGKLGYAAMQDETFENVDWGLSTSSASTTTRTSANEPTTYGSCVRSCAGASPWPSPSSAPAPSARFHATPPNTRAL